MTREPPGLESRRSRGFRDCERYRSQAANRRFGGLQVGVPRGSRRMRDRCFIGPATVMPGRRGSITPIMPPESRNWNEWLPGLVQALVRPHALRRRGLTSGTEAGSTKPRGIRPHRQEHKSCQRRLTSGFGHGRRRKASSRSGGPQQPGRGQPTGESGTHRHRTPCPSIQEERRRERSIWSGKRA